MKTGRVILIGRPNAGKSTLLNNLMARKVSITSPKPFTTTSFIKAVYNDQRGQIIFIDTPGLYPEKFNERADLVLYLLDHTRKRGFEENKMLGIIRSFSNVPKILVFNKIDIKKPSYKIQYKFMEEEFDKTLEISALFQKNLKALLEVIFEFLPEGEPLIEGDNLIMPVLGVDSKTFIASLVREKIFLFTGDELPYKTSVAIEEIKERENGMLYIKGVITTGKEVYKRMLIGKKGRKIKEIGMAVRKELETAGSKKVFLDLRIENLKHGK